MFKLYLASLVTLLAVASIEGAFKGIPNLPNLNSGEKREVFHYEHTIVIRDAGAADNAVRRCELASVYTDNEKQEAYSQLKKLNLNVIEVSMDKIMNLMKDCDSLESKTYSKATTRGSELKLNLRGITVPGTKWCGPGNTADNYHDIGKIRNVDICCRAHDHCPIYIRARDKMYNLTSESLYTTSHCLCDEAFYDCLKKDNGLSAKLTGNTYFDVLKTKCITGLPENKNEEMKIVPATRNW